MLEPVFYVRYYYSMNTNSMVLGIVYLSEFGYIML